eukprot:SAG31_NODE_33849_length_339_cov_0.866667_1_plen_26_part_01
MVAYYSTKDNELSTYAPSSSITFSIL